MRTTRRGFTLLEVLMAFGVSSMLLGVVYFFYFGLLKTGNVSNQKMDLNDISERALVTLTNDLRNAVAFTEFRPHRIAFQRLSNERITQEEMGGQLSMHIVEYELTKEKGQKVKLVRREPNATELKLGSHDVIQMDDAESAVFTGYVYDLPNEKEDTVPNFHVFDHVPQSSAELGRITMCRVSFDFKVGDTRAQLVSKVFLPLAHNNVVQGTAAVE